MSSVKLNILPTLVPTHISSAGLDLSPTVLINHTKILNCPAYGVPSPHVEWFKDGRKIDIWSTVELGSGDEDDVLSMLPDGNEQLVVRDAQVQDGGTYECRASNPAGTESLIYQLAVHGTIIYKLHVGPTFVCYKIRLSRDNDEVILYIFTPESLFP